jgi:23S rRNA pseudouridine2605 synthase
MERLQKVIANSGYCSRRKAEELIAQGKVCVNGNVVTEMGTKVSGNDEILVEGKSIDLDSVSYVYYLLNKPRGIISSSKDEHNRKTVVDLIETEKRIYPIGRLDYDTTGLILLTNDGDFANFLMHPNNNIKKTYLAKIEGILDKKAIDQLKRGVVIDDRKVGVVDFKVRKKDVDKNTSLVEVTIVEGRNHIVKRLFQKLGYDVIRLTRTGYGELGLGTLQSGEYRELTIKEVKKFYGNKK